MSYLILAIYCIITLIQQHINPIVIPNCHNSEQDQLQFSKCKLQISFRRYRSNHRWPLVKLSMSTDRPPVGSKWSESYRCRIGGPSAELQWSIGDHWSTATRLPTLPEAQAYPKTYKLHKQFKQIQNVATFWFVLSLFQNASYFSKQEYAK